MAIPFRAPLFSLCVALAAPADAQAVDYAALQATIGEPVTTSVTGKPQRASETPASIVIITRDQILRSPARDVPGLLKTYAGIEVNRWTAGQSDVAVRGGVQTYNARLLVLVNGRQVYLDHYGMTDWNLLGVQLEEIQQIELVRGPSTALFGFNAASGVVNIITVDALNSTGHITATAGLGNHGYSRIGIGATIPVTGNVGLRISGGRQREDERRVPAGQIQTAAKTVKRDEVDASLEVAPDARTRLSLDGGYSQNTQLEYLTSPFPSVDHFETETAGLRADRDTDWGSLSARAYINRLRVEYRGPLTSLDQNTSTSVAQASALVRLGLDNVLRLGAEYRYNRLNSPAAFSRQIDYKVLSGSAMLDLHPGDRIVFTLAGRLDRLALGQKGAPLQPAADLPSAFDRNFVRASFNAALLFRVGAAGQLRINGGRGYQLPSLVEYGIRQSIDGVIPGALLLFAGDPGIDPVAVWSAEIGYSQPLGTSVAFNGTIFYTHTDNVISSPGVSPNVYLSMVSGPALVVRFAAAGDFATYGTELSLSGKFGRHVSWRANYTLSETDAHLAPVTQLAFAPQHTTPRHMANVELGYRTPKWFATTVLRYTSSTEQFSASTIRDFGLLHVNAAAAWDEKIGLSLTRNLLLTIAGENLTKAGGAAGSQVPADRRVRATAIFGL